MALSVDRLLAVFLGARYSNARGFSMAWLSCAAITIINLFIYTPMFFLATFRDNSCFAANETITLFPSDEAKKIYLGVTTAGMYVVLPGVVLIIVNILIIIKMKGRPRSIIGQRGQEREDDMTFSLMFLSASFLVNGAIYSAVLALLVLFPDESQSYLDFMVAAAVRLI